MSPETYPFELIHEALLEFKPDDDVLTPMDTMEDFLEKNPLLELLVDAFNLDLA